MTPEVKLKITTDGAAQASRDVQSVGRSINALAANVAHVTTAFAAVTYGLQQIGRGVSSLASVADAFAGIESRLRLVTKTSNELAVTQAQLFAIAQRNRMAYQDVADTYSRFAIATKELGVSQQRLLTITEAISKAVAVGGGSAQAAQAAMVQLGQGMAAGALRGDELNSVMEQTPRLARAIAEGLGVTIGQLRKMGEQGELTGAAVTGALEKMAPKLQAEFEKMTPTVAGSFRTLADAVGLFVTEFDKGIGGSQTLAEAMRDLGKNIGEAAKSAKDFGAGIKPILEAGVWLAGALAIGKVATALKSVEIAAIAANLAMRANPLMLAVGALGWAATTDMSGYAAAMKKPSKADADPVRVLRQIEAAYTNEIGNEAWGEKPPFPGAKPISEMREYAKIATDIQAEWTRKSIEIARSYNNAIAAAHGDSEEVARLTEERDERLKKVAVDSQKAIDSLNKAAGGGTAKIKIEREVIDATVEAYKEYAKAIENLNDIRARATEATQEMTAAEAVRERLIQSGAWDKLSQAARDVVDAYVDTARAAEMAADAEKRMRQAREQSIQAAQREAQSLEEQVARAREENELIGLTAEQIDALKIARIDAAIAAKEQALATLEASDAAAAEVQAVLHQIDALRELHALATNTAIKQANARAIEEQKRAWDKFADDIERSLTDSLYRSFEAGKDFGETFVESLKNTIKAAALKLAVQVVVDPVMGQARAALGLGTSSGLISGANLLQNGIGSLGFGALQSGINTAAYSLMGGMGTQQAAMLAAQDAVFGMAGTSATLEAAGASMASGFASALPWVGGALAIGSLLGAFGGGGGRKTEGAVYSTIGKPGFQDSSVTGDRGMTGNNADAYVEKILGPLAASVEQISKRLGGNATGIQIGLGFNTDPAGDSADSVNGSVYINNSIAYKRAFGGYARGSYPQELAAEANRVLLAALKEVDLNDLADSFLDSLDIPSLSAEAAAQAAQFVQATQQIVDAFADIGISAQSITIDLINAFGSVDAVGAKLNAYYDAIFSEEEKQANFVNDLTKKFMEFNMVIPSTRKEFRALVESLDLNSDAGRKAYVELLNIAPTFAQYVDEAKRAADKTWQLALDSVQKALVAVERAINAQRKPIEARIDELSSIAEQAGRVIDDLANAIGHLRLGAAGGMTQKMALSEIDAMIEAARRGTLPDQDKLNQALEALTRNDTVNYATRIEWQRAQSKTASRLDDLLMLVGDQKSYTEQQIDISRQQLDALDEQLRISQAQVDKLKGIDNGIKSVEIAIAELSEAIRFANQAQSANALGAAAGTGIGNRGFDINIKDIATAQSITGGGFVQALNDAGYRAALESGNVAPKIVGNYQSAAGAMYLSATDTWVSADKQQSASTDQVKVAIYDIYSGGGGMAVYDAAKSVGLSLSEVNRIAGVPAGTAEEWAKAHGLPVFAEGGWHTGGAALVGENGPEIIVSPPARVISNNDIGKIVNIDPLLDEITALRAEVSLLRSEARASAQHTAKTARLIERAMPDGDALSVRTAT